MVEVVGYAFVFLLICGIFYIFAKLLLSGIKALLDYDD